MVASKATPVVSTSGGGLHAHQYQPSPLVLVSVTLVVLLIPGTSSATSSVITVEGVAAERLGESLETITILGQSALVHKVGK